MYNYLFKAFQVLQVLTFMSVICLDLVVWIFLIKGYSEVSVPSPKPQGKGNEEWVEFQNKETSINILVRGS